jgi:DNA mismatch endonuclease (patch repair protein)
MNDVFSKKKRSEIMSKIRKTNSKPEMLVRKFLFKNGFRFRIHYKKLLGNPDIVLPKYKTVVFVNGCFWHAHKNCKYNKMPKTNADYWIPKIQGNVERDKKNHEYLEKEGWNILTVWECDLEKPKQIRTLNKLQLNLIRIGDNI